MLPKGFRRARNYGFLYPNSKRLIALLRLLVFKSCGKGPCNREDFTASQTKRAHQRISAQWVLWLGSAKISTTRLFGAR